MEDRCEQCRFLYYDKKASRPSIWIGEGYYIWFCKKYKVELNCYLDGGKGKNKGNDVFRCNECMDELLRNK